MIYVYDIECWSNFFCVTFKEVNTKEILYFEISPWRCDVNNLVSFIQNNKKWFIGYNNHYYDNQLLNYISKNSWDLILMQNITSFTNTDLYNLSQDIIKNDSREYKYNLPFRSLDLMRVGNTFQKSLKLVGCNLQHPKLQDLPYEWNHVVTEDEVSTIKLYNLNDVEITEKLYNTLLPQIKLRKEISQMYNVNVMDESDSGIANKLLEKEYSKLTGLDFKEFKDLRTKRDYIHFGDVIFKNINFQTPELKSFLDKLRSFVLIKDKTYFKKKVKVNDIIIKLGVGGIHSSDQPGYFKETDDQFIVDADCSSMYPATIINYGLWPEHLDRRMLTKYREIRDNRLIAKKAGENTKQEALKLILNSTGGKFNAQHHWLYDPLQFYRMTVNGQLMLLMLIERLQLSKFKVISCNTDGVTTIVEKNRIDAYNKICKEWEADTQFELEYVNYKKYIRTAVNSYIAVSKKIKLKDIFVTDTPLQKGVDKKIIAIALQEYFIHNKSIKDTIMNHTNIYDFCIAMRTDPKFTTEYHTIKNNTLNIQQLQKTNRYYISKHGGKLFKVDKKENKSIDYCVGRQVIIFNDYIEKPISEYDIDYGYYISETQKIIDLIIPPQLTLF